MSTPVSLSPFTTPAPAVVASGLDAMGVRLGAGAGVSPLSYDEAAEVYTVLQGEYRRAKRESERLADEAMAAAFTLSAARRARDEARAAWVRICKAYGVSEPCILEDRK